MLHWKPFKNDEKCFLFHLKSSFRSQDILVFVTTFSSCRKNGLIRKIWLPLKFMTSQPALQTIAIHILLNISQSKCNQTMVFGPLIECSKRNVFFWKIMPKMRQVDWFQTSIYFWKSLIWGENKWSATWFWYISIALTCHTIKTNWIKL